MLKNLIIISNRLPISVIRTKKGLEFYPSVGGLATGLAGYAKMKNSKWIGWPGIASDNLTASDKIEITTKLRKRNCFPVFLTQKQLDGFYNGYSNSILWPLFHNLEITPTNIQKQSEYWNIYKEVNVIYANAVLKLCKNESNVWVHDYHLLLLPALLRQKHIDDKIGFFLHIPFPSLDVFLKLSNAIELILGVLGADLVGFHTHSYAKNFSHNCEFQKIGLLTEDCIALHDRIIRITNFPMGINYNKFNETLKLKSVQKNLLKLRSEYQNQKVILAVDRLDPTKGLIERISAYRELLLHDRSLVEKVILIVLAVPSRTEIEEYKLLRQRVELLINEINTEFETANWRPIKQIFQCLTLKQLLPLYQLADVAYVVPLIDGMNLVAKEYIASRTQKNGVLILSKTAGAAEELHDALIVDPLDPNSVLWGLIRSLSMPKADMQKRLKNMQKHVATFTVQDWANNFITSLIESPSLPVVRTKLLSDRCRSELLASYCSALGRVLLLSYDGTLVPFVDKPEYAKPTPKLKKQLKELSAHNENKIVIISNRDKDSIGEWFKDIPITLVVEHGGFVRKSTGGKWRVANRIDSTWKPTILTILEKYAAYVPNSFVEIKANSLVWRYRAAKPYYVNKYLPSLKKILEPLSQELKLKIEQNNMMLEVRLAGTNKGNAALEYSKNADFVMAIGDNITDEAMFRALPDDAWTIKVGAGPTIARYRVRNVNEVHNLLIELNKIYIQQTSKKMI